MTLLTELRDRVLAPALFAHRVPGGVLHDVGYSLWEMPVTTQGGGYTSLLREDLDAYDQTLIPAARLDGNTLNKLTMTPMKAAFFGTYGVLNMTELPTIYAEGTSLILQNCVLHVKRAGAVDSYYDIRPDIIAIRAAMNPATKLYIHIGAATNTVFPMNSIYFAYRYAQKARLGESNPAAIAINQVLHPLTGTGIWINTGQIVDHNASGKVQFHPVIDVTVPEYIALDLAHVADQVVQFGTTVTYVLYGEVTGWMDRAGSSIECVTRKTADLCAQCEPYTSFSAANSDGFRRYMQKVLGVWTPQQILDRWKIPLADSLEETDLTTMRFGPNTPNALDDWYAFRRLQVRAISRGEYSKAKEVNAQIRATTMSFGLGVEDSWLQSDFGSIGDWLNDEPTYLAQGRWPMMVVASFAKLSGEPCAFAISSPPGTVEQPPGQNPIPPALRVNRTLNTNQCRWWIRDVFCSGTAHISYRRAPGFSMEFHAPTAAAATTMLSDVRALQAPGLEQHGPYQKLHIQADDLTLFGLPNYTTRKNPAGRVADLISQELNARRTTYSLFSDAENVMAREFARAQLRRGVVISLFPNNGTSMSARLADLMTNTGPGAAIMVTDSFTYPYSANFKVGDHRAYKIGVLKRLVNAAGDDSKAFVFDVRPGASCEGDGFFGAMTSVLLDQVIPYVTATYCTAINGMPFTTNPIVVTTALEDVVTNFNTDGMDFTVAASNMSASTGNITVAIDPAVATALGVTYTPSTLSYAAKETKFLTFEATTTGIVPATVIADGVARLASLTGQGYDTAAGAALLSKATAHQVAGRNGRAIAAYVAACKIIYLKSSYSLPLLTINARRIGLSGESAGDKAVVGAAVQLFFPRNSFELHGGEVLTDGSGDATFQVGYPVKKRWSLPDNDYVSPSILERSTIEVQVVDRTTGDGTKLVRTI